MSGINVFLRGDRALRAQHAEQAKKKLYTLRGGSAGCLLADGTTLGACPHEALGRFMGYESNSEMSQGYFDGGIANEMIWERNIEEAIKTDPNYNAFRCEEDIPVTYDLDGKYKITGRPDLVMGNEVDGVFTPKLGMELKACFATGSGSKKLYGLKPDTKHLCQAAFYMKVIGCDWTIPYTINVTGDLGYFDKKEYARPKLVLGKVEFPIEFREDVLYYQGVDQVWVKTLITWEGILNFYRLIADMYDTKQVGITKISQLDAFGKVNPFDYNIYNDFTNMVPVTQGWDTFEKYCQMMSKSTRKIKYSKKRYIVSEVVEASGPLYLAEGTLVGTASTLDRAREIMYGD